MDGTSDIPGEPCETSMPRIKVGNLDTIGSEGEISLANTEFNPPSCAGNHAIRKRRCETRLKVESYASLIT